MSVFVGDKIISRKIQTQEDVQKFVGNRLCKKECPVSDSKYNVNPATVSSCLEEVYIGCTSFVPDMRFSLHDVEEMLNGTNDVANTCDIVKLKVTESTATNGPSSCKQTVHRE